LAPVTWDTVWSRERRNDMSQVPILHALILAAILFTLGLAGLLTRRNLIFTLLCIEVMLNASGLAFVAAGSRWGQVDGQIMFLFILAMAAAEVSVGLAFILLFHKRQAALDVDAASELRG
jgi:NADH-quinone oxidoreductase subunit K